jgi:hypothetical protein
VLLLQPNYAYRAITANPAERKAVTEAFAVSVLWGFVIEAQQNNKVLVDATAFFLRDGHDVIGALQKAGQDKYTLDDSRSVVFLPATRNFPNNTEIEVLLTYTGDAEGRFIRQVAPAAEAITVNQRHSFIGLPDNNYEPRIFDPRAGYFGISYQDYATAIEAPLVKRFIARHRLQKKNRAAARSEPVKPIVYYLDPGVPEPIRSALLDGARWWDQAFEAIGYQNAFQVKILPEDADPLDIRYNVIQWVHRATRGWSYGSTVIDPRTGEILKGHVSLGSLRVRQDYLIAQGLLAPFEEGIPVPESMKEMALARLRQLSAHEVGHTLGLAHNFAASVTNRASVMDYPHPYVAINQDGSLDFSDAYAVGAGIWDKTAIAYGYQDFPSGVDENRELEAVIQNALSQGLIFISDADARPPGGAHPLAHLWDNGSDAADELNRLMQVRKTALRRFSEKNIPIATEYAKLEEVLAPLYLAHRYQVDACAKLLGGLYYTYARRGDGQKVTEMVAPQQQRKALEALLATLSPDNLAISTDILALIPPPAFGMTRSRETFQVRTGVTLDALSAAETAAEITVAFITHPERAARLVEYHARDARLPGLTEVVSQLFETSWHRAKADSYYDEIGRVVGNVVLRNAGCRKR